MSVEKISPLARTTVEATASHVGGASVHAPSAARPVSAPLRASPQPGESASHLFDTLALPLAALAAEESPYADASFVRASYARASSGPGVAELIAGRLPEDAIRRAVLTLFHDAADARDLSIERLFAKMAAAPEARLPSRNSPLSEYSLKARVPARDADGNLQLFDLYATRAGPRQWEVAVFRHDDARRDAPREAPDFPRDSPPIDLYRLVVDPGRGLIQGNRVKKRVTTG
jgi:hypothetical protein